MTRPQRDVSMPAAADDEVAPLLTKHAAVAVDEEQSLESAGEEVCVPIQTDADPSGSPIGSISLLLIGVFVGNAEGSIVLAAYGRIASDFDDLENASWLVTGYVLAMSVAQPMYGKLSDIFGRTWMMLVAYTFFASGCAVCAAGQSIPAVVLGRVISGVGGAGMTSLVSIMITDLVPFREVGVWRSYVSIIATAGRAAGGPLGGWLTDTVGWRWSFLGQCPPILLSMLLTWQFVPNRRGSDESDSLLKRLSRVDFLGGMLLGSATLAVLLPLELGGTTVPWSHPLIYSCIAGAIVLGVLWVYFEAYWAVEPIMSPALLVSRNVLISNLTLFCQTAAQLGMMYTVPIYFQIIHQASASVAGAHLLPAVAGVTIGGLLGGYMIRRTGHYKKLLSFATICSSACYLLLVFRWGTQGNSWESLYIILGGFGNGLVLSTAFIALTAGIDHRDIVMACSSFYLTANVGTTVGMSTTSAIMQGVLKNGLSQSLAEYPDKEEIIRRATSNIEYVNGLQGHLRDVVVNAYARGFKYAHAANFLFAAVSFVSSLCVREYQI